MGLVTTNWALDFRQYRFHPAMQVLRVCEVCAFSAPPAFPPCSCPLHLSAPVRRLTSRISSKSYPDSSGIQFELLRRTARHERTLAAVSSRPLILIEAPSPADRRGMLRVGKTLVTYKKGTSMRFYTKQHKAYCGIELHARRMYVWILSQDGASLLHRHMQTSPEMFLQALAPSRADLVVAVACLCTWYGLADRCAREEMPFVLGHALSMKALPGGQANNDTSDAQQIAGLLRGGLLPQASVSPADLRAPRALLRRRRPLGRKRAARLTHVPHTTRPYTVPESGNAIAYKPNRPGGAERCADPAVPKSVEGDLALIDSDDQLRRDLELPMGQTAQPQDANPLSWLQTVPGIGKLLRLVLLDAIHDLARVPRVQDVVSYGRLGKGAKAAAGTRDGPASTKSGTASLTWAFSDAAVLLRRNNPGGQQYRARLAKKYGQGKALTILAPQLARAIYAMVNRRVACALDAFLQGAGRSAGAPAAPLGPHGWRLTTVLGHAALRASTNAGEHLGPLP